MRTGRLLPRLLAYGGLAVSLTALAGCGAGYNYLDPYQKPYTWQPTGAPAANLAAQLVDPHDLVVGRGSTLDETKGSTAAIERVWQDRPKALAAGASGGAGGGSSAAAGSGGSN